MSVLDDISIRVETTAFPPIDLGFGGNGPPNPLITALKPKVTVLSGGTALYTVAPYGEPNGNNGIIGIMLIAMVLIVIAILMLK